MELLGTDTVNESSHDSSPKYINCKEPLGLSFGQLLYPKFLNITAYCILPGKTNIYTIYVFLHECF